MPPQRTPLSLERARVRDVLRYYKSNIKQLEPNPSIGSLPEVHDDPSHGPSTSCAGTEIHDDPPDDSQLLSHDPTLTAFAQLAAFRLNCERSFISIMDGNNQFILAEATRSVSLNSKEKSDEGDEVYLGARVLDMKWGVCPNTIEVFTAQDDSLNIATQNVVANQQCYVMNDMSSIERYKDRPYIAGWPYMKFYAEVPIHSPAGYVIGTFCVVDNKSRNGLDQKGFDALNEISFTIMKHLELVHKQHGLQRAGEMMKSVGRLGEGRGALKDSVGNDLKYLQRRPNVQRTGTAETLSTISTRRASAQDNVISLTKTTLPTEHNLSETPDQLSNSVSAFRAVQDTKSSSSGHTRPSQRERNVSNFDGHLSQESISSTGAKHLFAHACYLIREALDVDGVIIVDTSFQDITIDPNNTTQVFTPPAPLAVRGIADTPANERKIVLEGIGDVSSGENANHFANTPNSTADSAAIGHVFNNNSTSELLGFSVRNASSFGAISSSLPHIELPQTTIQGLMQKYRQGHIFEFDEDGSIMDGSNQSANKKNLESNFQNFVDFDLEHAGEKLWVSQLLNICPGARSIIFHAIWDPQRDQWFAGCFAWTADPTRFMNSVDVNYLAAFGSCIMSEKSRLDALTADRAKADFISSISHELRTPLHGVLASAEALQETSTGSTQDDMIQTVKICSEILVDTMDQILDYTKLNGPAKKPSAKPDRIVSPPETFMSIDLGNLVETVTAGVFAGHNYRRSTLGSLHHNNQTRVDPETAHQNSKGGPRVILGIDRQISQINISQVSSWKRILTNLVGNALKYTTSGFVHVSLLANETIASSKSQSQNTVTLRIEDTGKGMSKDFLKYEIFTPFVQEDPHAPGTGLGLSIVRQLVTDLKGKIDVQSEEGYGTAVNVSLPVEISANCLDNSTQQSNDLIKDIGIQCSGLKLCVFGFEYYPDIVETPNGILDVRARSMLTLKSSLVNMAADWFGLEITMALSMGAVDGDLLLVLRSKWHLLENKVHEFPMLVFEDTASGKDSGNDRGVFPLTQPVGPHKMAKALARCLDYKTSIPALQPTKRDKITRSSSFSGWVFTPTIDGQHEDSPARLPGEENEGTNEPSFPNVLRTTQGNGQSSAANTTLNLKKSELMLPQIPPRSKVLLVEDNVINMKILMNYMKIAKQDFVTAENGLDAFEKFQEEPRSFKVIFMDLSMPVMDGLTSSRHIRAYETENALSRTRIVALTCFSSPEYQRDAALSGVDIFLIKPVPMKTLKPILILDPDVFDDYS